MKTFLRIVASRLLALLAASALALAQGGAQAQQARSFSQQELDQMLAPIALYPDALLSQILMASTYPLEVIEAARLAKARPDLVGDEAVNAVEGEDWDASVKSLMAFPQVLEQMRDNLQWTEALGDAFLGQQSQVMDAVQTLRRRAQAADNLRSDDRVSVIESGPSLLLQPYNPEVVYVPYYDPQVVYGSWWWPAYPPMYFRFRPGYHARPAYAGSFSWGLPVRISAGRFSGAIDWHRRQVRTVQVNSPNYNHRTPARQAIPSPQVSANRPGGWHADRRGDQADRSSDAQRQIGAASVPPDRGNQARTAVARPEVRFGAGRVDVRPEVRTNVLPPRDSAPLRPVITNRIENRHEWHANPQAGRPAPAARVEAPRAVQPRMEYHPAPRAARQETTVVSAPRHAPAAHQHVPQAGAPRAELRPPQAAVRQGSGAEVIARPRMAR